MPAVLRSNGVDSLPEIVGLPGMFAVFGPAIAAFILVTRESGRAGLGRLLRRAIETRFNKVWLLPTLLVMPVIGLITVGILVLLGEEWPDWTAPTVVTALGTTIFILFLGGGLEEFGWRGTLLVAILFHTAGNASAALLPPAFGTELGRWVHFVLLLITTIIVVAVWGWQRLNRGQEAPQTSLSD